MKNIIKKLLTGFRRGVIIFKLSLEKSGLKKFGKKLKKFLTGAFKYGKLYELSTRKATAEQILNFEN